MSRPFRHLIAFATACALILFAFWFAHVGYFKIEETWLRHALVPIIALCYYALCYLACPFD